MDRDPQVLKGLVLLLEDMQFHVIPATNPHELSRPNITQIDCPTLLVLPFELADNTSGIELVNTLRLAFDYHIPAILLSSDNGYGPDRFVGEEIVVLPERTKPKDLRRTISTILTNTMAV